MTKEWRILPEATKPGTSATGTRRVIKSSPPVELDGGGEAAVFHQDGETGVAHHGRIGEDPADDAWELALVAGFFEQFAAACGLWRGIAGIHQAAGDFQFDGVGALAILFDQDHLLIRGEGDDVDPVDAINDKEAVFAAGARGDFEVFAEGEDAEIAEVFGGGFAPGMDHGMVNSEF